MNRRIWLGVALAGIVLVIAAVVPWSFSDSLFRDPFVREIKSRTGLTTEITGRSSIALLPHPRLKFENVTIRDPNGSLAIEARSVKGNLRLLSLLVGRVELKSLSLDMPTVSVDLDAQPFHDGGSIGRALQAEAASEQDPSAEKTRLGTLTIGSGLIRLQAKSRGLDTLFQDVDATLDWSTIGSPALLSGRAVWRGEPARFDVMLTEPAALIGGKATASTLRLHGRALDVDATGSMAGRPRAQFEGSIKASTPSLHQLERMLGISLPLPGPKEAASIETDVSITGTNAALANVKLGLDNNAFEGSLAVAMDEGHAAVSGTLATDLLRLDAIGGEVPPLYASDGQWSREPFDLRGLADGELDLRVSAARVRWGTMQAEDAALSVLLKDRRMEVSLAEAQAYRGTTKLRAVATVNPPDLGLKINASMSGIDLGAAVPAGFGTAWLAGTGSGQVVLQSSGSSPAALFEGLEGRAQLSVAQGEISGINIEQALRRLEKRPLLSATDVHSGRTSFDTATATARIAQGLAVIENGSVIGPGAQIAFQGSASLIDRSISMACVATQTGAEAAGGAAGPQMSFTVNGPWEEPLVEPDAEGLIRRSDAAAPLLNGRMGVDEAPDAVKSAPTTFQPALR